MKNLIFFSQRCYDQYDLLNSKQPKPKRMVAVLGENVADEFPEELKPFFAKIYVVPLQQGESLLDQSLLDKQALCDVVEQEIAIAKSADNLGFVCSDEFNLSTLGWLRDRYDIPGASEQQLLLYRDKCLMKECLQKANLRVPKHIKLDATIKSTALANYYQKLCQQVGDVFVLKPVDGAGSLFTQIITDCESFIELYRACQDIHIEVEVEEYIQGVFYHCDSLIAQGKIIFSVASEYLFPVMEYVKSGKAIGSIPLRADDPLSIRIRQFSEQALTQLGLVDGVTHLEVFVTEQDEIVFIETAARIGGADIIPTYQKIYGFNFCAVNMQIQMGLPINLPEQTNLTYYFAARYPRRRGYVKAFKPIDIESQYDMQWQIKVGDTIAENSVIPRDYSAIFCAHNKNYATLYRDFIKMREYVPYETE